MPMDLGDLQAGDRVVVVNEEIVLDGRVGTIIDVCTSSMDALAKTEMLSYPFVVALDGVDYSDWPFKAKGHFFRLEDLRKI